MEGLLIPLEMGYLQPWILLGTLAELGPITRGSCFIQGLPIALQQLASNHLRKPERRKHHSTLLLPLSAVPGLLFRHTCLPLLTQLLSPASLCPSGPVATDHCSQPIPECNSLMPTPNLREICSAPALSEGANQLQPKNSRSDK